MTAFPRTMVGGVSMPRMLIGTNWFLGFSHTSHAKDNFIRGHQDVSKVADIIQVFMEYGIDAAVGLSARPLYGQSIQEAQQRTGKKIILVDTPHLPIENGELDWDEAARLMDASAELGTTFFFPHQCTTDRLLDPMTNQIRHMDKISAMIRERGMIPGLSTHTPQSVVIADQTGVDVATYIQIYNAAGFMMPLEVDWEHRIIHNAAKPVMTIKPMAAGRLLPLVGLAFVWATLREIDMVTVGTFTPEEAREDIEISLSILEKRRPEVELQRTRSKELVDHK